jgi:hypothetical protein
MFTHIVILKVHPWFLYADNEKEAMKICAKFQDDIAGVVSGKSLIVKHPRLEMTLEQSEVHQLEAPKEENVYEEMAGIEACEDIEKELQDELERHLPTQVD